MSKKILLVTSEVSGDLITSHLVKSLLQQEETLELAAVAGPKTEKAGAKLVAKSSAIGSMRIGWVPLLQVYEYFKERNSIKKKALKYLESERPDLIVLLTSMALALIF